MKPTKNRVFCKDCGKVKMLFDTEKKAENFIRFNSNEIEHDTGYKPERCYFCRYCGGWHVTSHKECWDIKSRTEIVLDLYEQEKEEKALIKARQKAFKKEEEALLRAQKREEEALIKAQEVENLKKCLKKLEKCIEILGTLEKYKTFEECKNKYAKVFNRAFLELENVKSTRVVFHRSEERIKIAEEKLIILQGIVEQTKESTPANLEEIIKQEPQDIRYTEHNAIEDERKQYIGKTLWLEVRGHNISSMFLIDNKYPAGIDITKQNYFGEVRNQVRKMLQCVPNGQKLLCRATAIHPQRIALRWEIENDPYFPYINGIPISSVLTQKEKAVQEEVRVQENNFVGKKLRLTAQRNEKNELLFPIEDKYIGRIITSEANYSMTSLSSVKNALRTIVSGQILLCKILKITSKNQIELRWAIEDDPFAEQFQFIFHKKKNKTGTSYTALNY